MYNDSFKIRYEGAPVAISENKIGADTSAHIHAEIELLYIIDGCWQVTVSDRQYEAFGGDVVIVNPYDVHSVKYMSGFPCGTRCICIDPSLIADKELSALLKCGDKRVKEFFKCTDKLTSDISFLFNKLYSAVENNSSTLYLEASAYISLMFSGLILNNLVYSRTVGGKKESFSSKVQEYLSKHYMENITSDNVAEELFYSQSYFCRLFKKQFGTSFLEYLSIYRISLAKAMLENSCVKVSEVAAAVGFLDSAYFSRCFKKFVGISPSEYKKYQYSY